MKMRKGQTDRERCWIIVGWTEFNGGRNNWKGSAVPAAVDVVQWRLLPPGCHFSSPVRIPTLFFFRKLGILFRCLRIQYRSLSKTHSYIMLNEMQVFSVWPDWQKPWDCDRYQLTNFLLIAGIRSKIRSTETLFPFMNYCSIEIFIPNLALIYPCFSNYITCSFSNSIAQLGYWTVYF